MNLTDLKVPETLAREVEEDNLKFEEEVVTYDTKSQLRRLRVYTEPERPIGEVRASCLVDADANSTLRSVKAQLGVECADNARLKPLAQDAKPLVPDDATLLDLKVDTLTALELELRRSDNGLFPSDCAEKDCLLSVLLWAPDRGPCCQVELKALTKGTPYSVLAPRLCDGLGLGHGEATQSLVLACGSTLSA